MMSRHTTFLAALILMLGQAGKSQAQFHREIELNFGPDQFRLIPSDKGTLEVVSQEASYFYPGTECQPALPARNISVLVPNGAELVSFTFNSEEEVIYRDIAIGTAPVPVPTMNHTADPLIEREFTGNYPDHPVEYSSTLVQRGFTCFSFTVNPFRYDGTTRELSLVRSLVLDVEYRINRSGITAVQPEQAVVSRLLSSVENPEDLEKYYNLEEHGTTKSTTDRIDYLVITTADLGPGFEPLLQWKKRKGLITKLVTIEEIAETYTDLTLQHKVKRCLLEYYTDHGLKWALLGGDHDLIPVQRCYTKIEQGNLLLEDDSVPTDLFYACLEGRFDWNSNLDDKIGEVFIDGIDLVPDIHLTRLPVRSPEQVRAFARKVVEYETNPPSKDFTDRILMAGVRTFNVWDGKSDSQHRSEWLFKNHVSKNWPGRKVSFFDTGTDFETGADYQVSADNLIEQINEGYGYVHFAGHGNNQMLVMENGRIFTSQDALGLSSPVSGIFLSNACNVNAFDSIDPCLSEALLRNPDGGCVGFFGSSRLGWGNPEQTTELGPSLSYNASFTKYLYNVPPEYASNSFGAIASMTKTDYVYNGAAGGVYLYLLYALNPMGDPELPLYTTIPSRFLDVRLYRIGNALMVNTGGIEHCRICVTSHHLEDGYHEVAEGVSYHTFNEVPESFQVTITKANYRPYRFISGTVGGVMEGLEASVRIYPNPVQDMVHIESMLPRCIVSVYDIRGRLLLKRELVHGQNSLDFSSQPDGAYLFGLEAGRKTGWFRVLKCASN